MKHTYCKLGLLLTLWPLVQLASGQGLTLTGLTPTRNARSAPVNSNVNTFTATTPNGLVVQVLDGVSYERVNGYEIRQTEQNQTGYFLIPQPGPYSITVIGANVYRAAMMGMFSERANIWLCKLTS